MRILMKNKCNLRDFEFPVIAIKKEGEKEQIQIVRSAVFLQFKN